MASRGPKPFRLKIVTIFKSFLDARLSSVRKVNDFCDSAKANNKDDDRYNILLIGETGSGKTSFLNLICFFNLIQEDGWDEALKQRSTVFNKVENELPDTPGDMNSKTMEPVYYKFTFKGLKIGFIDTPGFGDTGGLDKDKENVKKIIDKVNEVKFIHCICFVINGTNSRMTGHLQYVLYEISAILPKETVDNILIVFTRASEKQKASFKLQCLKPILGRDIPEKNAFYFDNPYCILQNDLASIPSTNVADFEKTLDTFSGMCHRLADFEKIYTDIFMQLYLAKVAVERKTCELVLQVKYKAELQAKSEQKKKEINDAVNTKARLSLDDAHVTKWSKVETRKHNTLCASCNSNCHTPCNLARTIDKEVLKSCTAMQPSKTECSVCHHSYDLHYHDNFTFKKEDEKLIDCTKITQFNAAMEAASDMEALAVELKDDIDKKCKEVEEETDGIYRDLLNKLTYFQERASVQNFKTLLENQLKVIEYHLEADKRESEADQQTDKSKSKVLEMTKKELEDKLAVLKEAEMHQPRLPYRDTV